eukprot:scaffold287612_cov21-Tisochrysis_lutea.AAC.2
MQVANACDAEGVADCCSDAASLCPLPPGEWRERVGEELESRAAAALLARMALSSVDCAWRACCCEFASSAA